KLSELTKFDTKTNSRGLLLGDGTAQQVQSQIFAMLNRSLPAGGRFRVLADVGLRVGSGGKLEFDEEKFRAAYASDPASVETLFTRPPGGLTPGTPLSLLNQGRGVRTLPTGNDLRIVTRDGSAIELGLADALTVGDVIRALNTAGAGKITAELNEAGSAITIRDNTSGAGQLVVSPLAGSFAAEDLGIKGTGTSGVLAGRSIPLSQQQTIGGLGHLMESQINRLIDPIDGLISRQNKALEARTQQFEDRIRNLDRVLEAKRARLERQFAALENALSGLQSQQAALGQIQSIRLPSNR
ncbi:MAG: flagellar filament capping protein FliD, partial [Phycisphaerales bacterium]|nr:flagellar filament capping protein FliD [Phycisphaerales bacterium]